VFREGCLGGSRMGPVKAMAPRLQREAISHHNPLGEVMATNVAPGSEPGDPDVIAYALGRWDRTARLCAIRLTEAVPAVVPLVWLILHR
jgi:hypothetical protein